MPSKGEERKQDGKALDEDKDREICHQLLSSAKENWLGEIGLTYCQLKNI